jgi:hypothetical protein
MNTRNREPKLRNERKFTLSALSRSSSHRGHRSQSDWHTAAIANYKRSLNHLELQTDIHRAREVRKKWHAIEKAVRRHPKRRF